MPKRFTGAELRSALDTPQLEPQALIEELLYDDGAFLLCADPEAGKSVIALQMAMALSSAHVLFNRLIVPHQKKVYFCQFERPARESLFRMKLMEQRLQVNPDNFCLDTLEGLNVLKPDHAAYLEKRISEWGTPDVIFFDPMYAMISGGLSKDEPATAITRFSTQLMRKFNCINVLTHHTHRASYFNGEKVEEDDPFYGSQWIKAHVTTSYYLRVSDSLLKSKVVLELKKSSNQNVLPRLTLHFDPDSYTSYLPPDETSMPVLDRVLAFLQDCRRTNTTVDFYQVQARTKCSPAHLRRLIKDPSVLQLVRFQPQSGGKTLWIPV